MKIPLIGKNGIGIDHEPLRHIFDLGYRGQKSRGHGVGLYISKLICGHQGRALELMPDPGKRYHRRHPLARLTIR